MSGGRYDVWSRSESPSQFGAKLLAASVAFGPAVGLCSDRCSLHMKCRYLPHVGRWKVGRMGYQWLGALVSELRERGDSEDR